MKDHISIVGAGISGLTAAICLAEKTDVTVFEKLPDVGLRFRNELQAYKNYDHSAKDALSELHSLNLNIKPYDSVNKIIKYSKEFNKKEIESDDPVYYLFLRGPDDGNQQTLEAQLKKQAEDAGVNFRFSETTKNADIIATGTTVPKIFGYGAILKEIYIEKAVYVFYDLKYAPKGYIFILPYKDNRALIYTVSFDLYKVGILKKIFNEMLRDHSVIHSLTKDAEIEETLTGAISYNGNSPEGKINDTYYVGESAGFVEPGRGFGLRYAFLSGYLAAKAISEGLDYNKLWKNAFGKEIALGYTRRAIFDRLSDSEMNQMINNLKENMALKEYEKMRLALEEKTVTCKVPESYDQIKEKSFGYT